MTRDGLYESPAAFARALTARLRELDTPWTVQQLQRQMAYDRLLERLYRVDNGWVVKGAVALLAREIGVRASLDVDIFRDAPALVAEKELRSAALTNLGDRFRFEVGAARPLAGGRGVDLPVKCLIGQTEWVSFHIDLVGPEVRMTGRPDPVPALVRVVMPGVKQHGYRAYPLVDHVADKVCAIFETHGRMGDPSSRFKDLVDLVAIVSSARVDGSAQTKALRSEAARRNLKLPDRFDVPDPALWTRGYAAEARSALLPGATKLDDALRVVGPFLDPLLQGTAAGHWEPKRGRWSGRGRRR